MLICLTVNELPITVKKQLQAQKFFPLGGKWPYLCTLIGIEESNDVQLNFNNVVFMNNRNPIIATFVTQVLNKFTYIPVWRSVQDQLKGFLYHETEYSGYINNKGQVCNVQKGKVNWSPLQPTRDHTHLPFHTHPLSAYKLYNATYGWPSEGDVHGVAKSNVGKLVSHLVVSLEGIYLMTGNITNMATCKVPLVKTKKHNQDDLRHNLKQCSWLLIPWSEQDWFMY